VNARDRSRALLAGVGAGIAGGLFGVGGGLVLVPVLTGTFAYTQHQAHATSLAAIGATAIASVVVYGLNHDIAWATAAMVALTSILTARYGARLARATSPGGLARVFAVFLLLVAARLLWKAPEIGGGVALGGAARLALDLGLGAAVGVLAGYMGVGGGILAVPVFTLVLGMTQQMAQGTSLAVIMATAPAGALEHHRHGNVIWRHVPLLAIGAAVGGPLGSATAQALPHAWLVRGFAVFLLLNAVMTWRRAGKASGGSKPPAGPQPAAGLREPANKS
jgi:uncharacterized membrane protein YfcA